MAFPALWNFREQIWFYIKAAEQLKDQDVSDIHFYLLQEMFPGFT